MKIKRKLKEIVKKLLIKFDLRIIKHSYVETLIEPILATDRAELLLNIPHDEAVLSVKYFGAARSQLGQDLFVLSELKFKRNGYFVEFGATNGITLSNTYLLESEFGWRGILAEPAKCWHNQLKSNRSAHIETNCVWKDSDSIVNFCETDYAELSTIGSYKKSDYHAQSREKSETYAVKTISLTGLLDKYNAPKQIDYLSIDTEGSELEILSAFDFDRYEFKVITCEHNYSPAREEIFKLLSSKGYVRRLESHSKYDDWYVKEE